MTKDFFIKRTKSQLAGDELIERTAKWLIGKGLKKVSRNESAFAYVFGRKELNRLSAHAFDYIYTKYKILNRNRYGRNFNDEVLQYIDKVAYFILGEYNKSPENQRVSVEINYPTGRDLEAIIRADMQELNKSNKQ